MRVVLAAISILSLCLCTSSPAETGGMTPVIRNDAKSTVSLSGRLAEQCDLDVNELDEAGLTVFGEFMDSLRLIYHDVSREFAARLLGRRDFTPRKPLADVMICIDAGHGGQNKSPGHYCGGTVGIVTGQTEGDVNLRVAYKLRDYLEQAGARIIMTRLSDDRCTSMPEKIPELDFRSSLARRAGAELFVSVHHNCGPTSTTNYTSVFFAPGAYQSVNLAQNIASAVSKALEVDNAGSHPASYRVLKPLKIPAVLIEPSFLSHAEEDRRLADELYNTREAQAIAVGIINYWRFRHNISVEFDRLWEGAAAKPIAETAQFAESSIVRTRILPELSPLSRKFVQVTYNDSGEEVSKRQIALYPPPPAPKVSEKKKRLVAALTELKKKKLLTKSAFQTAIKAVESTKPKPSRPARVPRKKPVPTFQEL